MIDGSRSVFLTCLSVNCIGVVFVGGVGILYGIIWWVTGSAHNVCAVSWEGSITYDCKGQAYPAYIVANKILTGMISNTMDAHRLLEFAVGKIGDDANSLSEDKLIARQNIVAESLYKV